VVNEMDRLNMIRIIPSIYNENTKIKEEIKCKIMFTIYFTNVKKYVFNSMSCYNNKKS